MGLLNMLGNLSFKALSICIYFMTKIKKYILKLIVTSSSLDIDII